MEIVHSHFRPEFLNRIDETVIFHRLTQAELREIIDLILARTQRLLAAQDVALEVGDAAKDLLVQEGFDPGLGARPLRRTVGKEVERRLARMLLAGDLQPGATVRVTAEDGALVVKGD